MLNNLIGHQFYGFAVALNWKGFLATAFTPNPYPKKKNNTPYLPHCLRTSIKFYD